MTIFIVHFELVRPPNPVDGDSIEKVAWYFACLLNFFIHDSAFPWDQNESLIENFFDIHQMKI
jgi:hypothetical protein